MSARLFPLTDAQLAAVAPAETVWLSASAGTGKTQVLSARVLRLLLEPHVRPEQILCLTFTKAGATEMAARINATLARWVRASDKDLVDDLEAIGADFGPESRARARMLFAQVLDCPGGGLRIDTIHAFSQWLLAAFPLEAGLTPGSRPMEEREALLLARQVLADLLVDAEARGDAELLGAVETLSLRMGPDAVEAWLRRCGDARAAWLGPGGWGPPMRGHVLRLLGLPADADAALLAAMCADAAFDVAALRRCLVANQAWSAATGQDNATMIGEWLAADPQARLAGLDGLYPLFHKKDGELKIAKGQEKADPAYRAYVERVSEAMRPIREARALLALADWLAPGLTLGRAFALAWDEAKAREGLIDFDDQIRRAAELLGRSDMAGWIRYKLDRRFDHILVDEAQDTNAAQWRIIEALTDDFFTGLGARDGKPRTLFVVGDYKQAIFGFQGTSPENFREAATRVRDRLEAASRNAAAYREPAVPRLTPLRELGLGRSYRTSAPVLDFVDRALGEIGHAAFGLAAPPEPHVGELRPGFVGFWHPIGAPLDDGEGEAEESGEEGWLSKPDRDLADRLARQIRAWIDEGFPLVKGRAPGEPPRRAGPGDVMILVRKRRELAGLIVARLHAAGVPVAGVDRLRLGAPLAVRDLIAALRFAAQPLDDLSLACVLVSPLIGWSQEQLLTHGWREKRVGLWEHLGRSSHPEVRAALALLSDLLARADFAPVQALLHWLLVGPWAARRRLVARLGSEAGDPIDELVNAAAAYAATSTPSLAGFLAWFDAGAGELKREAEGAGDLVRVMTVHGAKGLQAPIVILADATLKAEGARGPDLDLADPASLIGGGHARTIPLPALGRDERHGPIRAAEEAARAAAMQEHWRLLYVAMTRAEEALFITGALGAREKEPHETSWYARLAAIPGREAGEMDWVHDEIWTARAGHGALPPAPPRAPESVPLPMGSDGLPGWLHRAAGEEPRPPRPLAPSALGEDLSPDPPAAMAQAARRGTLIHRLLERLPPVAIAARAALAGASGGRSARSDARRSCRGGAGGDCRSALGRAFRRRCAGRSADRGAGRRPGGDRQDRPAVDRAHPRPPGRFQDRAARARLGRGGAGSAAAADGRLCRRARRHLSRPAHRGGLALHRRARADRAARGAAGGAQARLHRGAGKLGDLMPTWAIVLPSPLLTLACDTGDSHHGYQGRN